MKEKLITPNVFFRCKSGNFCPLFYLSILPISDDNPYDSDDDFKPTPGLPSQVENPKDDLPKIEYNATSYEAEETPASGCSIPAMTNKQSGLEPRDLDNFS
uniref:Uncharacterized protein n=1 Tax=Romanomermis culicivorax TaxID=13658 RepID=A0A915IYT3_ROMCU